jgi:putative transposase
LIKRHFSIQYREKFYLPLPKTASRKKRKELTIWQRRYWEHFIRDEDDLERHIDYIHYNPVKHGWVKRVRDWEDSSFHEYVRLGFYDLAWGDEYEINEKKFEFGE